MSEFSAAWLQLREPVDRRSRDPGLAAALRSAFAGRDSVAVVEIGCGTGANLRETAPLLGHHQRWTLLDHDPALLAAARTALAGWADEATTQGAVLHLRKGGRAIEVQLRQADLSAEYASLWDGPADLLTASAFFDLTSRRFIDRIANAVAAEKAAFHTVLTYNGEQVWRPHAPGDAAVIAAFNAHQGGDKGFGPAAGASATTALAQAFAARGYRVTTGPSPWRLDADDSALLRQLADGTADAAAETGLVDPAVVAQWRARTAEAAVIRHTDLLALPA